jgi:hypothetical protein
MTMQRTFYVLFFLVCVVSCAYVNTTEKYSDELLDVPQSYLSLDVNLPVSEIKARLQESLPVRLLDQKPLRLNKDKADSLYLTIDRYGMIDMAYRGGELFIAMPLQVEAVISKKVLGIRMSNAEQPVKFKAIARLSSEVDLSTEWDMLFACRYRGVEWQEEPVFNLLGFEINLSDLIEEQLAANAVKLEEIICRVVDEKIDFARIVDKVFFDIQKPNRIARNPFELYLVARPYDFKGELVKTREDTISMHVEIQSKVGVRTSASKPDTKFVTKPARSIPINKRNSFSVFAEAYIEHQEILEKLNLMLEGREFTYEEYKMNVLLDSVAGRSGRLQLIFRTRGDVNGRLSLTGRPDISEDMQMNFSAFEYELLNVDEDWVSVTDMAVHGALERYIQTLLTVDAFGFFDELDKKAMQGIRKSRLGEKMDVSLRFDEFSPYSVRVSDRGLQVIMEVTGRGALTLRKQIFEKDTN